MYTKAEVSELKPMSLFRHVFGLKPGQKLSEFVAEVDAVRNDEKFVAEVRAYAMEQAEA